MDHMLRRAAPSVVGARDQPASTHGWSRGSTRAPMPARATGPIVGSVHKNVRWMLPFLAVVLGASWSVGVRAADGPAARAARRRPACSSSLVAFVVAGLAFGVISRTRYVDPRAGHRAARRRSACSRWPSAIVQPDGAGLLALYITLGIACVRLEPRAGDPRSSRRGSSRLSALHGSVARRRHARRTRSIADASAIIFFFMGYLARQFRVGQARAEQLRRGARGDAARRRRRRSRCASASGSRARCTTCSPTRSRRSPCSSRARGCWRARAAPTPSVVAGRRAQPPPGQGRPRGGAARDRGAARRRHARARPAAARSPSSSASRPASTTALAFDGEPRELPSEARLAVYRTAQEALTNVRRHAEAERRRPAAALRRRRAPG